MARYYDLPALLAMGYRPTIDLGLDGLFHVVEAEVEEGERITLRGWWERAGGRNYAEIEITSVVHSTGEDAGEVVPPAGIEDAWAGWYDWTIEPASQAREEGRRA